MIVRKGANDEFARKVRLLLEFVLHDGKRPEHARQVYGIDDAPGGVGFVGAWETVVNRLSGMAGRGIGQQESTEYREEEGPMTGDPCVRLGRKKLLQSC